MKHLLLVWHSQSGHTRQLAEAAAAGARESSDEVELRMVNAFDATLDDLLWAHGLLLGTPTLSLLGGLGAALIVGARRAGPLIPLLILPLCVPVLIFGVAAGDLAGGADPVFPLTMLAALLLGTLALAPWGIAAALRAAGE